MGTRSDSQGPAARERIFGGVIAVLASEGLGRLTHRSVAKAAGVSLAATTYHYRTKADMLADVSARFMADYIASFERLSRTGLAGGHRFDGRDDLIFRLVEGAATRHNQRSLAWCELIVDAARTDDGQARARDWFAALLECWRVPLGATGEGDGAIQSAIDVVIGMTFMVHALGLDGEGLARAWGDGFGIEFAGVEAGARDAEQNAGKTTPKARRTRAQIVEAAITLLMRDGGGGVTYRAIAELTGMTQSTPSYYFKSIVDLLREAEVELFRRSKERYRALAAGRGGKAMSLDQIADLTAAIFTREATENALASIAHYSIWLEAARQPALRAEVTEAIVDQARSWQRRLSVIRDISTFDGLWLQALFVGALVRNVACGSNILEISRKREEFLIEFHRLAVLK